MTLYHKTFLAFKEWKLGFLGVVNATKKSVLRKGLVVGYERDNTKVVLKGEQIWDRPTRDYNQWRNFFSHITLTALHRRTPREQYGVEVHPWERRLCSTPRTAP